MYTPPPDLRPFRTNDGSFTLRSEQLDEQYHSRHGAVQESQHVFIEAGCRALPDNPLHILEVGLGTGLNLLLTWIEALRTGRTIRYTALEPFLLPAETLSAMDHPAALHRPDLSHGFLTMMTAPAGEWTAPDPLLRMCRSGASVVDWSSDDRFDLVYFDAFGPRVQPGMWSTEVFDNMFAHMRPGGLLVTYCAKGDVRRAMQAAGLVVERLPGPPGKREMIRAMRPMR